jgi:hypothetical protein
MRIFLLLLCIVVSSIVAFCSPDGALAKVKKIRVDPTVVEQPEKVKDSVAPNLVRYNLRAAVRDAHLLEGDSPIRAHVVLDNFSSEGPAKRVFDLDTGKNTCTVDGRLVIEDDAGKELASVPIHIHGSVDFGLPPASDSEGHQVTSDLERRLIDAIGSLK